jgi:tetratricopeptide (TPR) repeat protein
MGAKSRYLIIILFLFRISAHAQNSREFNYVDSLTYSYYNSGNWDSLIELGKIGISNGIDYKYLRQRLGFAYFAKENYSRAKFNFEKALQSDSYDQFTLEYLYYSFLNTGKEEYTGSIERKLNPELRKKLSVKSFKPIEGIDFEYSYKYAGTVSRSDPMYFRLGVSTRLAYRISLYQSVSNYKQVITTLQNGRMRQNPYRQPEYFALLKWNISEKLLIRGGYHFVNTISGSSSVFGNLFVGAVSTDFKWFSLEANGSVFDKGTENVYQAGGKAGFLLPGRSNITLSSSLSGLIHQDGSQMIYSQIAGIKILKKVWVEGNVTFGKMEDYNDFNGLYIYNTYDPMVFRSGASVIFYAGNKVSLWVNYSYEKKEYLENNSFHYNQFSFTGGIRWKI